MRATTFKHALVRDTAYETLLKSRRQILHPEIASAAFARAPRTGEPSGRRLGTLGAGQKERPKYPEKSLPDNNG